MLKANHAVFLRELISLGVLGGETIGGSRLKSRTNHATTKQNISFVDCAPSARHSQIQQESVCEVDAAGCRSFSMLHNSMARGVFKAPGVHLFFVVAS